MGMVFVNGPFLLTIRGRAVENWYACIKAPIKCRRLINGGNSMSEGTS